MIFFHFSEMYMNVFFHKAPKSVFEVQKPSKMVSSYVFS